MNRLSAARSLVRAPLLSAVMATASLAPACSAAAESDDSLAAASTAGGFAGLVEGSDMACAVLRLANEASAADLDRLVGLDARAARNIATFRLGPDGEPKTEDDQWFASLSDLGKIPYVKARAFQKLRAHAATHADFSCGVVDVQLLAFNDFHGNLKPPSGSSGKIVTGPNATTDFKEAGGAEYFATHIKNLRAENPNTLVVAAGDIIGATPLPSALFHDEPTIESMNALGLDVATVGNHEFDEGADELLRMKNGGCHPVDGCQDGDGFAGASFSYLSANVVRESTGKTLLPSYAVRSFRGARIGFIGVTLEGTPLVTSPSGVAGLRFKDEVETINALVPELHARGVHAIVVLIHEGGATTGLYNECAGISGPLFEIVANLSPAIDAVVAGHTNAAHVCNIGGKLVTSAAAYGRLITDIDLAIDEKTGRVVSMQGRNVIATRDVAKDAEQTTIIAKYDALAAPIANKLVGSASADLLKPIDSGRESSLGDLIADAQLAATSANGAVAAFMNPGGVRADIVFGPSPAGEAPGAITYGEAFTAQPFGNTLMTLTVTGDQLKTMLEQQWTMAGSVEKANLLQVSAGFSYTWDSTKPIGSRVDASTIKINGQLVQPTDAYRITVNAFLADGGDGFAVLKNGTNRTPGGLDLDALLAYFAAHPNVTPPPVGRITKR
jgi:5'-nucleotidase